MIDMIIAVRYPSPINSILMFPLYSFWSTGAIEEFKGIIHNGEEIRVFDTEISIICHR